jgi:putative component of toxin-antitoxin plasmid stabilization module
VAAAKVTVAISRLELGNFSNMKWLGGIGEYRINWGPGYCIYLAPQEGNFKFLILNYKLSLSVSIPSIQNSKLKTQN